VTDPYYQDGQVTLLLGDALDVLREMPDESVDCVVTSPPYFGLRSYLPDGVALRDDITAEQRDLVARHLAERGLLTGDPRQWQLIRKSWLPESLHAYVKPAEYGAEDSPAGYVATMRAVFAEARRVLAKDGTCWINLGDSYSGGNRTTYHADSETKTVRSQGHAEARPISGLPGKNLLGIPWRVAFALQDDGWILRNDNIWHKSDAMPESVRDRFNARHEHTFLLTGTARYWFDLDAVRERHALPGNSRIGARAGRGEPAGNAQHSRAGLNPLGRNPGDVWVFPTGKFADAHFATFPVDLPIRCIKAGCKPGGTVLDPFSGSGTTGEAARRLGRKYVGIDLNPAYHDLAVKRFAQGVLDLEAEAS